MVTHDENPHESTSAKVKCYHSTGCSYEGNSVLRGDKVRLHGKKWLLGEVLNYQKQRLSIELG